MSAQAAEPAARGLPRGALLVILFEFFERFGFYSMLSLLALFLIASRGSGGFAWSQADALALVGVYTGLMYGLPVLGGLAADRLLGHRQAIALGGTLMLLGYGALTVAATANPTLPGPLGSFSPPTGMAADIARSYTTVSLAFWAALAALVAGNALMKSTLVIVLGDTFPGGDTRREAAYAYYYMGINVGGLIAGVSAGAVAVSYGWAPAFATSAMGMGMALVAFLVFQRRFLGNPSAVASGNAVIKTGAREPGEGGRILLLAALAALLLTYHVGAFQVFGTMSLYLEREVDRQIGSFLIPTQWFTSVNAAALILSAPLFAVLWARLGRAHREPDILAKYALALALGAAGLLLFAWSASATGGATKPGWIVPAIAIAIQAAGEVAAWTSTYGIVYRVAPRRMVAGAMGAFYAASIGLGGYVSGWLGRYAEPLGFSGYFLLCGMVTVAIAVVALIARPALLRLAKSSDACLRA